MYNTFYYLRYKDTKQYAMWLKGKKWDDGMDGFGNLKPVLINTDICGKSK